MRDGPSTIEATPGHAGLTYLGKKQPRAPAAPSPQQKASARALFGPGAVVEFAAGVIFGWRKVSARRFVFAWARDGSLVESGLNATSASGELQHWDRGRAFLTTTDGDSKVWAVDALDGAASLVFDGRGERVYTPLALAHDRALFILHTGGYVVCRRAAGGGWFEERRDASDVVEVRAALAGRIVVYTSDHRGSALHLIVSTSAGLREAPALPLERGCQMYEGDDGPWINVEGDGWYALSNLDSVAAEYDR